MLKGKHILLGVTGGIAAYKAADVCSRLIRLGADVEVIMTENACQIISPIAFEALCHHRTVTDTFDRNHPYEVEHIALAEKTDGVLIAPATANIIGKLANGIADDMLSTTMLAVTAPRLIAPAMNTHMWENPVVQDNIRKLEKYGWIVIPPAEGHLACGTSGRGKLPDPEVLASWVVNAVSHEKDMTGLSLLVTAGPTREALDPVRFLSNHSTGKMGYSIAAAAAARGARVTLVSGPVQLSGPVGTEVVDVVSAEEMYQAVTSRQRDMDIIIKAAAVADYRPENVASEKMKKKDGELSIPLARTKDILKTLGENKPEGQFLCGFSMETENMIENSRAKLQKKRLDLICANNIKVAGAGFGVDTNVLTLISENGMQELPLMSKWDAAVRLLDEILKMRRERSVRGDLPENR